MVTLAEVKRQLGITGSSDDVLLNQLISQARAHAEGIAGRKFGSHDFVEFYDGTGSPHLILNQSPVIAVTKVRLDQSGHFGQRPGTFGDDTILAEGVDYSWHGQVLYRINGWWPAVIRDRFFDVSHEKVPATGNIKVSYSAGYECVPADVKDAIIQLVGLRFENPDGREAVSESLDYYSVSYGMRQSGQTSSSPTQYDTVFRAYRKPRFA